LCQETEIAFAAVFEALGAFVAETDKNYDWDTLTVYRIHNTVLQAESFGNITFNHVNFRLNNFLTSIHPAVFSQMTTQLETLSLENNEELVNETELFQLLNSVPSLKSVLVLGSSYREIPSEAFQPSSNLLHLEFREHSLESIGSRAFFHLHNLETLILSSNLYEGRPRIHKEAFEFQAESAHHLLLSLWGWMNLPSDVLDAVDFRGFNGRNVTLDLSYNQGVDYLNETTFQGFLDGNSGSEIYLNSLGECFDCRHAWLVQNNLIDSRVRVDPRFEMNEVRCLSESSEYLSLIDQTFAHCNPV